MAQALLRCTDYRLNDIVAKKFTDAAVLSEIGGIKWHMSRDAMEELFEQLEFLIEHQSIKSLVIVSHGDCDLYQELGEDNEDQYQEDLLEAATQIGEHFPEIDLACYLYDTEGKSLKKITHEL